MSPSNVVITGCNRGIGLELVKQYLKSPSPPSHIVATYRDPARSTELLDLARSHKNLHPIVLDVSRADTKVFDKFAAEVAKILGEGEGINLLINNAALGSKELAPTVEVMREVYEVNCLSPYFLTRSLLPLIKLASSAKSQHPVSIDRAAIVMISSLLGSISAATNAVNRPVSHTAYRVSKAALNMVMKNLSLELRNEGIVVISMHPGHVKTDMGGADAPIDTETCCSNMLRTLEGLTEKDNGGFKTYDDKDMTW